MRKKIDLRKNVCLLGAVIMLGACGQAENAEQTTAAETETQAEETTADLEENESEDAEEKDSEKESAEDAKEADGTEHGEDEQENDAQDAEKEDADVTDADAADGQQAAAQEEGETAGQAVAGAAAQEGAEAADDVAVAQAAVGAPQGGKSVAGIYEEITQKVALDSPMVVPDDFISNYYGIDVSALDEYVFSMSEAAISAETVVILKAKDSGSTGSLSAALQTVIDQKRSEMENYLPDQFQIVDRSSVQVQGSYVYLVISEQADAIRQIIQAGIQ